ncbi:hypothetical protein MBLNU459_g7912t1 [Dothideomycetes sp. NU459]
MMASRILSRFLPNADSVLYDAHDGLPRLEQGVGHGREPEQRRESSDDHELDALLAQAEQSESSRPSPRFPAHSQSPNPPRPRWMNTHVTHATDAEDDVPQSLLLEGRAESSPHQPPADHGRPPDRPAASRAAEQWRKTQDRQQLYLDHDIPQPGGRAKPRQTRQTIDAREQAMWTWASVRNLDAFLLDVYQYYIDHGIWSILLSRTLYLLSTAFLFSLFMFLSSCIDFAKVPTSKATSEVLIPRCMQKTSFAKNVLLWVFVFWWGMTFVNYLADIRRLWSMHEFYHHLLGIPDTDIQTVPWERVVEGLMKLRNANAETADAHHSFMKDWKKDRNVRVRSNEKQRMDAHDIANRLMRRDNYFIALFNKEIFDLTLSVPFVGNRQFYSKSLEFCLNVCFNNFVFDEQGQVMLSCLKKEDRDRLIVALRNRLRFAAIISIFMAPLNIGAHCIYFFSRYYAEFRNSPSQLSARAFTPLAEWKFREFNELNHDFRNRMRFAYSVADKYLDQFPKDKMNQFLQFVSLISGTLAGLLGLATLLDPELFLGFEITSGRTAFFYISVLMAIFAGARGAVPDDSEIHEPVPHLMDVMDITHYQPDRWKHHLHSNEVRVEFSALYQMKVLIFAEEILSLVVAPFILWKNSGDRSERIVDFFRESTVEVNGLGHLCSFAVFKFRKHKNIEEEATKDVEGLRDDYFNTKDDKMAMSQYYFMQRLGQYDQHHGSSRYGRPHYGMRLPPSFPPLSPQRPSVGNTRQSNVRVRGGGKRPIAGDYLSPDEGEEDQVGGLDAMTTSKLIEQDSSLAESWKALPDRLGTDRGSDPHVHDRRASNGVLGLLVEYSKAHAGGKGPKIG